MVKPAAVLNKCRGMTFPYITGSVGVVYVLKCTFLLVDLADQSLLSVPQVSTSFLQK